MHSSNFPHASWRKSSRSNHGGGGNCVEVAELVDRVALRDSKHPAGPVLTFAYAEWRAFLSNVRTGELT